MLRNPLMRHLNIATPRLRIPLQVGVERSLDGREGEVCLAIPMLMMQRAVTLDGVVVESIVPPVDETEVACAHHGLAEDVKAVVCICVIRDMSFQKNVNMGSGSQGLLL